VESQDIELNGIAFDSRDLRRIFTTVAVEERYGVPGPSTQYSAEVVARLPLQAYAGVFAKCFGGINARCSHGL
jgi:hypothetical protein